MKIFKILLCALFMLFATGCSVKHNKIGGGDDSWNYLFDNDELISVNKNFNDSNLSKVVK